MAAVRDAVADSLVAEFATVRDGRPATVPLTPFYDREREVVVVTASPAFAGKAERAAANSKVGLLLCGADGPVHITGTATVRDDDLRANAARVEQLIQAAPPSQKRSAMRESMAFLDTRIGRLLLDWYAMRILIEIEPDSIIETDSPATSGAGAWPVANVDEAEAATYDRSVVTVVTEDGWPRTWALGRSAFVDGTVRLDPPPDVSLVDRRPACVLCHWFSPDLHDLGQRLVRGRLREEVDGFRFDPASSFRLRNETTLDFARFVVDGKRRTRRYFRDREETYWGVPGIRTLLG